MGELVLPSGELAIACAHLYEHGWKTNSNKWLVFLQGVLFKPQKKDGSVDALGLNGQGGCTVGPTRWAIGLCIPWISCRGHSLQAFARILGVNSPFFSAIVLFKNRSPCPQGFCWFSRKIGIPGFRMELEVTPGRTGKPTQ